MVSEVKLAPSKNTSTLNYRNKFISLRDLSAASKKTNIYVFVQLWLMSSMTHRNKKENLINVTLRRSFRKENVCSSDLAVFLFSVIKSRSAPLS